MPIPPRLSQASAPHLSNAASTTLVKTPATCGGSRTLASSWSIAIRPLSPGPGETHRGNQRPRSPFTASPAARWLGSLEATASIWSGVSSTAALAIGIPLPRHPGSLATSSQQILTRQTRRLDLSTVSMTSSRAGRRPTLVDLLEDAILER
jgi:hypothetical protein